MEILLPLLMTLSGPALNLIAIGLGFGIVYVSCLFLISYGLQNPQMIALSREELAALLFSVFIILFWLGFDTFINGLSTGLLHASLPPDLAAKIPAGEISGLKSGHLDIALATLDILSSKLKDMYVDLYLFEALIGFLSTVSFPLGSPFPAVNIISFSLAPFTGLTMLSNAHTVVVEAIGYLLTVVWAKEFILIFARDAVPLFLLPLGLVLRAFPFFRKTGSSVIALAFAAYFVLPFALILSNYLMFDIFKPADFAYTPAAASIFDTDRDQSYYSDKIGEARNVEDPNSPAHGVWELFQSKDVIDEMYDSGECTGNFISKFFCSVKNVFNFGKNAAVSFVSTVFSMWWFMMGMTGDFISTGFTNPLMPASASAGLFHFIIMEVSTLSSFIILVMVTTVIEIVITVTMYRNVSLLLGGEAELIGLTKIV